MIVEFYCAFAAETPESPVVMCEQTEGWSVEGRVNPWFGDRVEVLDTEAICPTCQRPGTAVDTSESVSLVGGFGGKP